MEKRKYNESFELVKSVMALMVIGIHTILWDKIPGLSFVVYPMLRIAVPIFFMFSGYFFFRKIRNSHNKERFAVLKHSLIRYLKLYSLWYLILMPVSIVMRDYFKLNFIAMLYHIVQDYFIGSAFLASWYIGALIVAIPIVFLSSLKMNNCVIVAFSVIVYVWCVLLSNYGTTSMGYALNQSLKGIPFYFVPYMNFPVGLIWISLGKVFADTDLKVKCWTRWWVFLICSMVALYAEQMFVVRNNTSVANDAYFMLIPFCIVLFSGILSIDFHVPHARLLRAFSTIGYCFHDSFQSIIRRILGHIGQPMVRFSQSVILWLVVVLVCLALTKVILILEKRNGLKWLRYTH